MGPRLDHIALVQHQDDIRDVFKRQTLAVSAYSPSTVLVTSSLSAAFAKGVTVNHSLALLSLIHI